MSHALESFVRVVTTAGITILIAFLTLWAAHFNAPYHTDLRQGSFAVMGASLGLNLLWAGVAGVLAMARWKATTRAFRIVLSFNGSIAALCVISLLETH